MNILAVALVAALFLLLWDILLQSTGDWRAAFLGASIVWTCVLVAITEILNLFRGLTFAAVLGAWSVCFLAALAWWLRGGGATRPLWKSRRWPALPRELLYLLVGGALISAGVGLVAALAPPNTNDALTYHMPRVMHWLQNRSLVFYPTHILRQLYLTPGSEFIVLHLQLLSGGDHLANFVQWFSMLGCAVGVSLLARELGADLHGQVFSAAVSLAIPVGILQASSPQSDYVTAFWLTGFAYWMFRLASRGDARGAAAAGASLGLAALTKSTAYIFAFPLLLWLVVLVFQRHGRKATGMLAIAAVLFVLLNLGTYVREYGLFGNPLGMTVDPMVKGHITSEVFSPAELASNVIRNTAMQLGTPLGTVNSAVERAVSAIHRLIGISENDRDTTWVHTQFHVRRISFFEYTDGNLLHLLLILLSGFYFIWRPARNRKLALYALCLLGSFVAFCLVLKWQPWSARLQLPLFVLYAPVLGRIGQELRPRWVATSCAILVLAAALPWVLLNQARPLLGEQNILTTDRTSLYFRNQAYARASYVSAVQSLADGSRQCRHVGLYMDPNDLEYVLWVLLQERLGGDVLIESVNVDNISAATTPEFPSSAPCAVLATHSPGSDELTFRGRAYALANTFGSVSVFVPK